MKRFSQNELKEEYQALEMARELMFRRFDAEISLYEQDIHQPSDLVKEFDTRIFPYHPSCYLLLDMFRCVEYDGEFPYPIPYMIGVKARNREIRHFENGLRSVNGQRDCDDAGVCYLPCSTFSSFLTLIGPDLATDYWSTVNMIRNMGKDDENEDSDTLIEISYNLYIREVITNFINDKVKWMRCEDIVTELNKNRSMTSTEAFETMFNTKVVHEIGLSHVSAADRTKTLLRLFKHSMSDLQGDYRLATTVLLAFIRFKTFDGIEGVDAFRYFLVTLESEYIFDCGANHSVRNPNDVNIDSPCGLQHSCKDFHIFLRSIGHVIQLGITYITDSHVICICSFLNKIFDQDGFKEVEMTEIIGWDPDVPNKPSSVCLVISILRGLVGHNNIQRFRLTSLLSKKYSQDKLDKVHDEDIGVCAAAHKNCVQGLLTIGESVLRRIPANPLTARLGSLLTTGLSLSCIFPISWGRFQTWYPSYDPYFFAVGNTDGAYIGRMYNSSSLICGRCVMDIERYANCIRHASTRLKDRLKDLRADLGSRLHHLDVMEKDQVLCDLFLFPNHTEITTIVKGLFLRQLVECNEAGLGYGDFLIFSNSEISPFDELLFEHNMNYPNESGFYDGIDIINNEHGLDEDTDYFFKSEENLNLSPRYVRSTYDMSLLLLRREWEKSWTPLSHMSFQKQFQDALNTVTLVAHRHGFPFDLSVAVNSYLSRDWWNDERKTCWLYDCQVSNLQSILDGGLNIMSFANNVICSSCKLAAACSTKHLKIIQHEGHKRKCGCPPLRIPTIDDISFCNTYNQLPNISSRVDMDGDDDWDSDKSLITDDIFVSLHPSSTHRIYKYFRPFYISTKREGHSFERYYSGE